MRALETLREADVVFCEDTRRTLKLLNAYEIKKPLFACHKFNEASAAEKIIERAERGENVVIVSDAGMPVISDPGNVVCKALKVSGVGYTVVPGATAFACALVLSGMDALKFTFLGFLPDKKKEKLRFLEKYKTLDTTLVFHSAPQDVDENIAALRQAFGNRAACAVREITKIHEESVAFFLAEGLAGEKRGEYVLLVEGAAPTENPLNALSETEHIRYYTERGLDKKEALKRAAKDRGVSKSALYKFTVEE